MPGNFVPQSNGIFVQNAVGDIVVNPALAVPAGDFTFSPIGDFILTPTGFIILNGGLGVSLHPAAGDVSLTPVTGNLICKPVIGGVYLDKLRGQNNVTCGISSLSAAGQVNIPCADVAADSVIVVTAQFVAPLGILYVQNINAGADFDVWSTQGALDAAVQFSWFKINPQPF